MRLKANFYPPPFVFCFGILISLLLNSCSHNGASATENKTFEDSCKFINALDLNVINKGFDDTELPFSRLPAYLKDSVRPTLWDYQKHSAGIAVRFRTNSSFIGVRYKLLMDFKIPNMAFTGIKGTDLYAYNDGVWKYVQTSKPERNEEGYIVRPYVRNLDTSVYTEYMIYLPLYDGVESFEIGISPDAIIDSGDSTLISPHGKIVAYGTSIMQGGSASRTGMAATNIISRELGREVINLGFSGQGRMDYEVARAMAGIPDVSCYIVDPVPNCSPQMCDSLTVGFVNILLNGNPNAKVVMVGGPEYPHSRFDKTLQKTLSAKDKAFYNSFLELKEKNSEVYYVKGLECDEYGEDYGTVDGVHLSNLGFRRYCDNIIPVLNSIIQ